MFTLTFFEILLFKGRSVLSPAQQGTGSKRVKTSKWSGNGLQNKTSSEYIWQLEIELVNDQSIFDNNNNFRGYLISFKRVCWMHWLYF